MIWPEDMTSKARYNIAWSEGKTKGGTTKLQKFQLRNFPLNKVEISEVYFLRSAERGSVQQGNCTFEKHRERQ